MAGNLAGNLAENKDSNHGPDPGFIAARKCAW